MKKKLMSIAIIQRLTLAWRVLRGPAHWRNEIAVVCDYANGYVATRYIPGVQFRLFLTPAHLAVDKGGKVVNNLPSVNVDIISTSLEERNIHNFLLECFQDAVGAKVPGPVQYTITHRGLNPYEADSV